MSEPIRYLTFNIQYHRGKPYPFFEGRGDYIRERLPLLAPDIVSFQEVTDLQKDFLEQAFPAYQFLGTGRDAGFSGERMLIGFLRDKFEVMFLDTFWLSETPRLPASRFGTDQSPIPRICTTVTLVRKSDRKRLRVYNAHLCHIGPTARIQGMSQVLSRMADDFAADPLPVILSGDFNACPEEFPLQAARNFTGAGPDFRDVSAKCGITYHEYHPDDAARTKKIDYIFTTLEAEEGSARTVRDHREDGMYLSDHFPILTTLLL